MADNLKNYRSTNQISGNTCHSMKAVMNLLSLKTVPTLFWTAPSTFTIRPPFVSVVFLLLGLVIFGLGHAILFASNLGVSPWMVLSQGITVQTGWSIGWTIVVVSFLVLMFWIPLKQVPGLGTFINFFVVAAVVDVSIKFLPSFDHFLAQSLQALIGIFFIAIGTGVYLIANLGPGPRDGLMTGLQRVTNFPLAYVRNGLEITVVIVGWCIGGTAGIATLTFALFIGPATAIAMQFLNYSFPKP